MSIIQATQKGELGEYFKNRPNQWIPLPEIIRLGIAQYNARIYELRHQGLVIQNKILKVAGQKCSWYRYVPGHSITEADRIDHCEDDNDG